MALTLGSAGLGIGLALPLASLPIFAIGHWQKAEPLVIGFHGGAVCAALAVAASLWRAPAATLARVCHPTVVLPLILGLWSLLAAPFTELPLLSLLGAPQSGYGGLWFIDTALYGACALLLAEHPRAWRHLCRLALAITVAVAALKLRDWWSLRQGGNHLLIFVAAYYGWLALALPMLPWRVGRPAPRALVAPLAVAVLVAVASLSMTAVGLLLAGVAMTWACLSHRRLAELLTRRVAAALVIAVAALPWLALHGIPLLLAKESLRDRYLVHTMLQTALAHDPQPLFGHGWGRSQDAFRVWLNVTGERLWDPIWTYLRSDYFHSHNWALETFYAAGLPGFTLMLAGMVAIAVYARAECRPAATALALGLTLFSGMWFPLSLSVPLTAMAVAAVADRTSWLPPLAAVADRISWSPPLGSRAVAVLPAILAAAIGAAGVALLLQGMQMSAVHRAWQAHPPQPSILPVDFRGSDEVAAEAIRDQLSEMSRRAAAGEPTPPLAATTATLLDWIDRRAADTPTILLLETGLNALAQIHLTGELTFAAAPGQMEMGRRWLDRLLTLAPGRSDMAIPTLTLLIAQGRTDQVAALADRLLAANPGDPVGLHYRGLVLVMRPDPASKTEGFGLFRSALANGIERFIPIDQNLKNFLGSP